MTNVTPDSSIDELVLIPGGEFFMGSYSEGDHSPVH
jgi:formylglycine-generating enzyme required for sulfatase activity